MDPETTAPAARPKRRPWLLPLLLLVAGLVVFAPALRVEFMLDDWLHAAMIDGTYPAKRGVFNLYDFVNDRDRAALADHGMLPWWSHPKLKVRFLRPLPSALLWADHRLFGRAPLPLHLHSLAWWFAVVLAARSLYGRLLSRRSALLATWIFALAPCHALPLAWLANREALVSLAFGLPALGTYLRFRDEGRARDGLVAAVLFALSMSGGEYAMCLAGYVLAIEIVTRGAALRRWIGVLPFVVPAAVYLGVRARLGYGTYASGFYSDPLREPAVFLAAAPRRLSTLLAQAWLGLDGETPSSTAPAWLLAIGVALGLALLVIPMRRALAALDDARRRTVTWLLLGSFFALAPVLAVVPSPRVLGASLVGIAAAVAVLLEHAWFPEIPRPRRGLAELTELAALTMGFAHLVHGPATAWFIGREYRKQSSTFLANAAQLRESLGAHVETGGVHVLRALGEAFFMPFALRANGAPPPRWRILAQTGHVLALRRGPRTVDLIVPQGQAIFPIGSGNLFRDTSAPVAVGETYGVPGLRATILETSADGPRVVRIELDRPLDDESNVWITEDNAGFRGVKLPAVGFGQPFNP